MIKIPLDPLSPILHHKIVILSRELQPTGVLRTYPQLLEVQLANVQLAPVVVAPTKCDVFGLVVPVVLVDGAGVRKGSVHCDAVPAEHTGDIQLRVLVGAEAGQLVVVLQVDEACVEGRGSQRVHVQGKRRGEEGVCGTGVWVLRLGGLVGVCVGEQGFGEIISALNIGDR